MQGNRGKGQGKRDLLLMVVCELHRQGRLWNAPIGAVQIRVSQASAQGLAQRDVKNEDRSDYVYENT